VTHTLTDCGLGAVVLVAFSAPMVFDMLRPQLTGVYAASVKPIMSVVVAKIHTAHAFLNGLDNKRQAVLAAGVAVVILIVWQLFGSYISLCSILSFFATCTCALPTVVCVAAAPASLALTVHACVCGACSCVPGHRGCRAAHLRVLLPRRQEEDELSRTAAVCVHVAQGVVAQHGVGMLKATGLVSFFGDASSISVCALGCSANHEECRCHPRSHGFHTKTCFVLLHATTSSTYG